MILLTGGVPPLRGGASSRGGSALGGAGPGGAPPRGVPGGDPPPDTATAAGILLECILFKVLFQRAHFYESNYSL